MQVMISAFQPQGDVSGQSFSDISAVPKDIKIKQNGDIYSIICDGLGGNSAGILFGELKSPYRPDVPYRL